MRNRFDNTAKPFGVAPPVNVPRFAPGHYAPDTSAGRKLLAHELTHVVQQQGARQDLQTCSLGPERDSAEHEAHAASSAVAEGRQLPAPITSRRSGVVQRSVAGAVGGALFGAGFGATVGAVPGSLAGPVGAIVGGIVGGLVGAVAGLIVGETETVAARGMTPDERTEAKLVFGHSLDYDKVRIAESRLMSFPNYARTPFNTIYFPPGTSKRSFTNFMPWLIHELTHVWQTQHGISVLTKLAHAIRGKKAYDYSDGLGDARKEEALARAWARGKHFLQYNTEQQGDILQDYYEKLKAGDDTSAYDPFVAEVKNHGRPVGRTLNDRNLRTPGGSDTTRMA